MTAEIYLSLKWLHIASACIGFGSNVTHIFWLLAANADPVHGSNILRLIKKIDDRLAVPAYIVTTICGTAMFRTGYRDRMSVNARCLEGVDIFELEVGRYDGRNLMPPGPT